MHGSNPNSRHAFQARLWLAKGRFDDRVPTVGIWSRPILRDEEMIEWFEDLAVGMRFKSGTARITEDDIKQFATKYDPQPFHFDDAAARKTLFKGLAASGWHTAAVAMSLAVQTRPFGPHPLIGLGVNDLRWMLPVRPGDVVFVEGEVVGLRLSKTKPQGTVLVNWTMYNQNTEPVYTFTPIGFVLCRPHNQVEMNTLA